jgi:hypothetical protein
MPFLQTPNTNLYYDICEPDFTASSLNTQDVLVIHGFVGMSPYNFSCKGQFLMSNRTARKSFPFFNVITHHSRNELGKSGIFWHTEEHERRTVNHNRAHR